MRRFCANLIAASALLGYAGRAAVAQVRVVTDEKDRRVDISIDGQPFTSYIYPPTLKKPVLFPLRTAKGTVVTRGFPPGAGERTDHPHHVGLWFNYGNVDGIDFWNNSEAVKPEDKHKMGTIEQRRILAASSGSNKGELEVEADWNGPSGTPMLREHTLYVFFGGSDSRTIERVTTLTAVDRKVTFVDDKEGLLGMRVTRALELPSATPETFTDASGRATRIEALNNSIATGDYLTSEGKRGNAVWGSRGRWCELSGRLNSEAVTLLILDHPKNPGFPTYWHARGYGLFAANPLGEEVFSRGREKLNLVLDEKQSVTFRYRVVILSEPSSAVRAETEYQDFSATSR